MWLSPLRVLRAAELVAVWGHRSRSMSASAFADYRAVPPHSPQIRTRKRHRVRGILGTRQTSDRQSLLFCETETGNLNFNARLACRLRLGFLRESSGPSRPGPLVDQVGQFADLDVADLCLELRGAWSCLLSLARPGDIQSSAVQDTGSGLTPCSCAQSINARGTSSTFRYPPKSCLSVSVAARSNTCSSGGSRY